MRSAAVVGESSIKDMIFIYDLCSKVQFILYSNGVQACDADGGGITCDVGDNKWYARQSASLVSFVEEPPNSSLSHRAATDIRLAILSIHVPPKYQPQLQVLPHQPRNQLLHQLVPPLQMLLPRPQ
jgi:hypothetical protein